MKRSLFTSAAIALASILIGSDAYAANIAQRNLLLTPPLNSNFQLCSTIIPDGCQALASQNATIQGLIGPAQPGLYTFNSVNGPGSFWNYARQSGQQPYKNAQGRRSSHPISLSGPGLDYGIGPWTPTASLLNPTTYNWAANLPMCSYTAASHFVRCNLTGSYAPTAIKGYISGSTLVVTSGTASVGQYVYYGVANPTAPDVTLLPYKLLSGSAGNYALSGSPPNVGSAGSPIDMNVSNLLTVQGFNFDDVFLFGTGTGLLDSHNNRFTFGTNLCASGGGTYGTAASGMSNTYAWFYSNYIGDDATCSSVAMLYPKYGAKQSSFTGTVTTNSNFGLTATIAANSTSLVVSATTSPLSIGTLVNFTGTGCSAQYIKSDGTATGGAGTYTLGAVAGGLGTTCTPTTATNTSMAASAITGTISLGQYVTGPTAWTNPVQFQIVDYNTSQYYLSPSNGGAPPVSNAAMSTGPILSTWGFGFGSPTGGGAVYLRYNYSDKVGTLSGVSAGGSVECSNNYIEVQGAPGFHVDPCTAQLVQTTLPQGSTLTIPFHHQNYNTSLTDALTTQGVTYGGYSGTLASGGGTAGIIWFSTFQQNSSTGYYVYTQDLQIIGNTIISNNSTVNIAGTKGKSNGYSIYLDTQGSTNPGPYPGSVGTVEIYNNAMDSIGANGCIFTSPYIYTTPGGSTSTVPSVAGNFSLNTGGAITNSVCQ